MLVNSTPYILETVATIIKNSLDVKIAREFAFNNE